MTFEEKKEALCNKNAREMNTIVWKTKFVIEDFITSMSEDQEHLVDKLLAMSKKEFSTWVRANLYAMENMFHDGIMYDWDYVARVVMGCLFALETKDPDNGNDLG